MPNAGTTITTARVLSLAELRGGPSKILDCATSARLGDGRSAPGDAPPWTVIQVGTVRLLECALPGWWFPIGPAVAGGVEFTVEPLSDGPVGYLLELQSS